MLENRRIKSLDWYQNHSIFFKEKRRVEGCEIFLPENEQHLKYNITGDETWMYVYNPKQFYRILIVLLIFLSKNLL